MEKTEKDILRGGQFMVKETNCEDVFTPEDFSEEQKMMKEAILYQEGQVIDYTLTGAVDVGDVVPLGTDMIGIASTSGLTGEVIALEIAKVWQITAATADVIAIGDLLYFDATNRVLTTVSTSMVRAGRAISAKAAATAGNVYIKINAA